MSSDTPKRFSPALLFKLALVAVVLAGVGVLLWLGLDIRGWIERGLDLLRSAGPLAFFTAMAVLPALGFPVSIFTLSAAPVFSERLGLPLVLFCAFLALGANLALTYWLGRFVLRSWVVRLLKWTGHGLPVVQDGDQFSLTVLVRITPGPPFWMQSYLLAVMAIPFRLYLLVSWVIAYVYSVAFILFGESIAQGKGRVALLAASLFIALAVIVKFIRRHYARKRAALETSGIAAK